MGKLQMAEIKSAGMAYICPMHASVRQSSPGKCPKCGMALVPENTRFALLRHMTGSWPHIAIMVLIMIVVMAAVMMMLTRLSAA